VIAPPRWRERPRASHVRGYPGEFNTMAKKAAKKKATKKKAAKKKAK
jgi:hypothetical protein